MVAKSAKKRRVAFAAVLMIGLLSLPFIPDSWLAMFKARVTGQTTNADRIVELGPQVGRHIRPAFDAADVNYPPTNLILVAYKAERRLELYARDKNCELRPIKHYPILGASGSLGPKLREGDGQVPEGIYTIDGLNSNSQYHLSLHLNYPNAFDRDMAKRDSRKQLGHSIFIHGGSSSIGCLAMGDDAAEELFILVAQLPNREAIIVIAPSEDMNAARQAMTNAPAWINELYGNIEEALLMLKPIENAD